MIYYQSDHRINKLILEKDILKFCKGYKIYQDRWRINSSSGSIKYYVSALAYITFANYYISHIDNE